MSEKLAQKSWNVAIRAVGADDLEIAVYDTIGKTFWGDGTSAKDIHAKLRSAPKAKKISLRINSLGGIVDEAKAMVNVLEERKANGVAIEATVDGIAASAASYLLTSASKVIMPANAFMMLHGVRGGAYGTAPEVEARGALLRRLNDQLAEAYSAASARRGVTKSKADYLAEFAKGDLYLDADEAIAWGLADEKLEPVKVAACLADWDLLAEDAPHALLSAPYLARAEAPSPIPTAPPPAAPKAENKPPATGGRIKMNKAEIKEKFPEVYAAILEEGRLEGRTAGTESERKRVNALLKLGTAFKAMDIATKAIAEGKSSLDEEVAADFQVANVNRLEAAARQEDSDKAGEAVKNAKSGAGASAGAPGAPAASAVDDGEDPDLLVAAADIFCGPRKTQTGKKA